MAAPFGPKAAVDAEAGDLVLVSRGTGAALEVEKLDPSGASLAALIAAGIDAFLGGSDWRTGGTGGGGSGAALLNGTGAASGGANGDFYIRTSDWTISGPKAAGVWPTPVSLVGPAGATGASGSAGAIGSAGTNGSDGKTVRSGSGAPAGSTGVDGDFYIRTSDWTIYGPKAGGSWGAPASLVGPTGSTGSTGATGAAGAAGADGRTILYGTAAPTTEGVNGDFYIRTSTNVIYGPKAGGVWPAGVSLIGPQGATGATGSAGAAGANGADGADGAPLAGVSQQTGTIYTFVLGDANTLVECSNASAIALTVPPNASVGYPVGTTLNWAQGGAGQVTLTPGAGVTLQKAASLTLRTTEQHAVASAVKVGTNTWRVFGDLEAA